MNNKLNIYKAVLHLPVYIVSENEPTEEEYEEAVKDEIYEGGGVNHPDIEFFGEVENIREVDEPWKRSIPWATEQAKQNPTFSEKIIKEYLK